MVHLRDARFIHLLAGILRKISLAQNQDEPATSRLHYSCGTGELMLFVLASGSVLHGSDDAVGSRFRVRAEGPPHVAVLRGARLGPEAGTGSLVGGDHEHEITGGHHQRWSTGLHFTQREDLECHQSPASWKSCSQQASSACRCVSVTCAALAILKYTDVRKLTTSLSLSFQVYVILCTFSCVLYQ